MKNSTTELSSSAAFLEQISDAFFELDKDWCFTYLNDAATILLNRPKEDMLGQNIWHAFPEAIGSSFYNNYHTAIASQEEILFEEYYPPLDTWFFVKAYPTDAGGLWVFFSNINKIKETENRLKESELNFRSLFENMTLGVVYQDEQARIISANPTAQKILGLTLDEMMGRVSADPRWKAMDDRGKPLPPALHPSVQALDSRRPVTDFRMQIFNPKTDEYRWLLVDSVPQFRSGETEPFQVFSLFRDITERQKALAEREEMMHVITHDLRSPIRSAQVLTDMISEELGDKVPEVSQDLHHLHKSLARAVELTNGFVDSMKLKQTYMPRPVEVYPLLEDVAGVQEALVQEAGLEWRLEIQQVEQLKVAIDNSRFKQILENLIGNAIKFTPTPGHVLLRAYPDAARLVLEVEDSGKGITPDEKQKIFKKFWQPNKKGRGVGLGLYIVKKITDAHAGTIEVSSQPQMGTTFKITLPISFL